MNKENGTSFGRKIEAPLRWGGGLAIITGILLQHAPLAALGILSVMGGVFVGPKK